jgi:hypothetical protein
MTNEIMRQYQNNQPSSNGNSFTIAFLWMDVAEDNRKPTIAVSIIFISM